MLSHLLGSLSADGQPIQSTPPSAVLHHPDRGGCTRSAPCAFVGDVVRSAAADGGPFHRHPAASPTLGGVGATRPAGPSVRASSPIGWGTVPRLSVTA